MTTFINQFIFNDSHSNKKQAMVKELLSCMMLDEAHVTVTTLGVAECTPETEMSTSILHNTYLLIAYHILTVQKIPPGIHWFLAYLLLSSPCHTDSQDG